MLNQRMIFIMKKYIVFSIACILSGVCVFSAMGGMERPWGNKERNIQATQEISKVAGIRKIAVLSRNGFVLVGIETLEGADKMLIKKHTESALRKYFSGCERCLLGIDNFWADSVLELPFYIDGGMNRKILEKRFEYLAMVQKH